MSTATIFNGATSRIIAQLQGASLSDVPSSPAAIDLPFQEAQFMRNPVLQDNDTFNDGVLDYAQDETDEAPTATMTVPYCLNSIGFLLTMLFGQPVTTGSGVPYTHTFTASNCELPSALFEAKQGIPCDTTVDRMRVLGMVLNQMAWDPLAQKPTVQCEFIASRVVAPMPVADFDSDPTRHPYLLAVTRQTAIADVIGSSTLGLIAAAQITLNNRLEGVPLADGLAGVGAFVRSNKPLFNGSVTALWESGKIYDYARSRTSKALKVQVKDATGTYSMTTSFPKVKFTEAGKPLNVRGGIRTQHAFQAHYEDGDGAPTIVLVNQIASYA